METLPNRKESGVNKIVGVDSETEKGILDYFKNKFENNPKGYSEKEHSQELDELINRVNTKMKEFLGRYGVKDLNISPDNIHVLDRSNLTPENKKKIEEIYKDDKGLFNPKEQAIIMLSEYEEGNKLSFTQTLVHEMIHQKGFYSYELSSKDNADVVLYNEEKGHKPIKVRRSGFEILSKDGKNIMFYDINESIITELEIRFEQEYIQDWPEMQEDFKEKNDFIKFISANKEKVFNSLDFKNSGITIKDIESGNIKNLLATGKIETTKQGLKYKYSSYSYHKQRKEFNEFLDDLYERNKKEFSSREKVFNLFAEGMLTGRILPIARLIEKTYGKGSFRELANHSAKVSFT